MWFIGGVIKMLIIFPIAFGYPEEGGTNNLEATTVHDGRLSKYELVYEAQTWGDARTHCEQAGGHLAVAKSNEDFSQLQDIVRHIMYNKIHNGDYRLIAWVGVNNLEDSKVWKTVTGVNLEDSGYFVFASTPDNSNDPRSPHCAGVDAQNQGYRDWWCHHRLPFICESQEKNV